MKEKAILRFFLILIFTLLSLHYAAAQAGRGKARIAGVVKDEQGNRIASAKIVIEIRGRHQAVRKTTANKKGEWSIMGLGSGNWRITATADGYAPADIMYLVSQIKLNKKITLTLKKIIEVREPDLKNEVSVGLIEQADQLFLEGKYDEVLALLNQFLEINPEAYQTRISIGDCYKEKGEYEKALEEYNLALETAKNDEKLGKEMTAKALSGIGDCYLRRGDFEKAQNFFKESIELLPDNEILAYNVGEIYFSNQKMDEAIQYYALTIKIKPGWSHPYYKIGLVHLNKTEYEKAEENFNKFLELEPYSELAGTVRNMLIYLEKIKK
jgi:tetratricopeptide (TPR) repeat protein